jgi:hypothetical protein
VFPVVAASPLSKSDLYIAWEDNSTGNYEIYFGAQTAEQLWQINQ